jgi:transposase
MLRLHAQGESKLKISELTGVSRNTLKNYLKIYARLGLSLQSVEQYSDQELDL